MIESKFKETEIGLIPENWNIRKLSDIIEIIGGGTPRTTFKDYWNGDIPWLSVVDFNNDNRFVYKTEKTITERGLRESSTKILKKGHIIISARGTVGEIAQLACDMAFNQSCYGLNGKEQIINDFLYYLLKNNIRDIKKNTHGSVFDTITRNNFDQIIVSVPSIEEQKSISEVLTSFDEKIDLNHQMNKNLEQIAQALFKRWFIDFEFPDENGKPYKSSGGRMVDSELGKIPEGWKVVDLKEMSKIISKGTTPSKKQITDAEGTPSINFIKVKDIADDGQINRAGLELIHESIHKGALKRSILSENDLLFSIAGTIGRVSIVENDLHNSNINQAIAFIRLNGQEYLSLVLEHLKSKRIQEYAMKSVVQGVQANVSLASVGSFQIVVPNDPILTAWNEVALSLHNEKLGRQKQNRLLSQLRNTLLPKLLSGKIRVDC
ncbi:restriction endonuclease subunit S [Methanosarcina sp. 1.H.A.2.2]|uniref:restriction endonuclease subunit S n=1 Tax=Methanosarcina sp. 1.H.A.2.2 TaxID=1483601 RepID=UPI00062100D8|nr:restriction endonuclease subunit S [Methanosarcina sp. 1.H.A.2.2]KKH45979.1 hypothetical protein EO93_06975 [Methanosarcina sp. 1.H.A.2.2]